MTSFHASSWRGTVRRGISAAAILIALAFALPNTPVLAQTTPPVAATERLSETTIKALQEALNAQGIVVKADGALTEETRAAIRKYQSQHHLPVTGEPDQATLGKLGVTARQSTAPGGRMPQGQPVSPSTTGQAQMQPGPMQPGQMPPGQMQPGPMQGPMMMNCPMMQAQMQGMMQMMQGMMQMMQMMQTQMQPPAPPPGSR